MENLTPLSVPICALPTLNCWEICLSFPSVYHFFAFLKKIWNWFDFHSYKMFMRVSAAATQKHPACIHPQGISNQQILWNIIVLNMEACGNGNLQEHSPVPYSDARLVLIMLWGCEIAKVAQLYILPCLSFVLPPLFLFLYLYPVTQIMLSHSILSGEAGITR